MATTYTGPTTGYEAGAATNESAAAYAQEQVYNQPPTGAYQALRYTDISLAVNETDSQPDEINDVPEMAESVLTGRSTQGSLSGILSVGTFDDMLAGVMTADWQAQSRNIIISAGATPPITGSVALKSAQHNGRDAIALPAADLASFPDAGFVRVVDKTQGIDSYFPYLHNNQDAGALEFAAGTLPFSDGYTLPDGFAVYLADIQNGKIGKTWTFLEYLAGKWQIYSGTIVSQVQITLQKGQPATVSIDLVGSDMTTSDATIAGSVTPRTSTPLINTVEGFLGCNIFGSAPAGCIQSATITLSRDGSGQDDGMGHVGACGVRFGSFKAAMEITYLFRDYQQFTDWKNGKRGPVSVGLQGSDGLGYQFVVFNGVIRNPKTPVSGKNQTVVATVSITANPVPGGGTFGIFRTGS